MQRRSFFASMAGVVLGWLGVPKTQAEPLIHPDVFQVLAKSPEQDWVSTIYPFTPATKAKAQEMANRRAATFIADPSVEWKVSVIETEEILLEGLPAYFASGGPRRNKI